jgi:transcriptional regulator with XRE-family HTH domain
MMARNDDIRVEGTTDDYLVQKLTDEEHGQEFTAEYLKAQFLSSAANTLFTMRHQAGLTQAQVAERLHTKQSAIARLEADFDGSMSLRRYAEFALACGVIPHHITFAPVETARAFVIAQPEAPFTQENQRNWRKATFQLVPRSTATMFQPTLPAQAAMAAQSEAEPKQNPVQTQAFPFPMQESASLTSTTPAQASQINQLNAAFQKAA